MKGPFKDSRQSVISDMHPHREMDLFQHYAGRIYPANASGASQEQLATVIHRKMAAAGLELFLDETSRMEEKSAAGFHVERVSVRIRELPADRLDQLIMGIEWIEPVLRFNKLLISRTDQGNLSIEMTVERWSRTLDSNPGV